MQGAEWAADPVPRECTVARVLDTVTDFGGAALEAQHLHPHLPRGWSCPFWRRGVALQPSLWGPRMRAPCFPVSSLIGVTFSTSNTGH